MCPKISFSEDEVRSFYKPWSKALIVKVLERNFQYQTVKRRLETLWARSGYIQVTDAANSFYLVRFSDPDDYQRAAFKGPWKIYDYYISVACWTPQFNEEEPLQKILTWVRLPRLPIHFFNELAVTRIGNHIGRTVRLDLATSEGARARYARVCIEVDISKPLLGKYMIEDRTYLVEYESLENICHHCGLYGHIIDGCSKLSAPQDDSEAVTNPAKTLPEAPEGDAGSWMTVCRRNKGKSKVEKPAAKLANESGSRFSILQRKDAAPTPHSSEKPTPEAAKTDDPTTFTLAAELAAVLKAASAKPKKAKSVKAPAKPKNSARDPLSDISNATKTNQQVLSADQANSTPLETESTENLVQVPVTYDNPIFQGADLGSGDKKMTKAKTKKGIGSSSGRWSAPGKNAAKADDRPTRNFTPRPSKETSSTEGKRGVPPDMI
ncbi:hypothetical protein LINPERHAP1_LOCUS397 [Linum perenne]